MKNNLVSGFLFILYLVFFVSLVFSLWAITSIFIVIILVAGVIYNRIEQNKFLNPRLKNPLLISCCLFFLFQAGSLFFTDDLRAGWGNIELKSAIVIIPPALCCCNYLRETTRQKLLHCFCMILFAGCLVALYAAFRNYAASHDIRVFLYHPLVAVFSGHAVQFSIFIFIALLHLLGMIKRNQSFISVWFHYFLVVFFFGFLFLLSSKLVIIFSLLSFVFTVISFFRPKPGNKILILSLVASLLVLAGSIFLIPNPVNNRFREILGTDFSFLKQDKFSPARYFNGLEFRLLEWRFVPQILDDKRSWLAGVSVGDAQSLLDQKYISENMYTGSPARGDRGFIGYNTHNEFLEALLQTGVIGLALFVMIIFSLFKMAFQTKRAELSFVVALLIAYSFTESVFETEYAIFIFLFFPLFYYSGKTSVVS